MASRHQRWQCMNLNVPGKKFLDFPIDVPKRKITDFLGNLSFASQISEAFGISDNNTVIASMRWIKVGSNIFITNENFVLCPLRGAQSGSFGKIVNIFMYKNEFIFRCKMFNTLPFDKHLQAFPIGKRRNSLYLILAYKDLLCYRPYHLYNPMDLSLEIQSPHNLSTQFIVTKTEFDL